MNETRHEDLIHDWNDPAPKTREILFDDETLRDGLQSPSVRDPELDEKLRLVHLMEDLGIDTADIGLPGASARAREHILALAKEMAGMRITPNVACRTLVSDIAPTVEVAQASGAPEVRTVSRVRPGTTSAAGRTSTRTGSALQMRSSAAAFAASTAALTRASSRPRSGNHIAAPG